MQRKTEDVNPRFADLDLWPTGHAVEAMFEGQLDAVAATRAAVPAISKAADAAAARIGAKGRLVYAGAGTSGRLAVMDAVELGPTFGWPAERLCYRLAGGEQALVKSAEGAEDNLADGEGQIAALNVTSADIVICVAASGRTPFTLGVIRAARRFGALTIGITNNPASALLDKADHPILAATGSEVLAGSTRMKAGTAQKAILNMLSTAIMLRLGRIYKGYMVDMTISNAKLSSRAVSMVSEICDVPASAARAALETTDNHIKQAILVCSGLTLKDGQAVLRQHQGDLRAAMATVGSRQG